MCPCPLPPVDPRAPTKSIATHASTRSLTTHRRMFTQNASTRCLPTTANVQPSSDHKFLLPMHLVHIRANSCHPTSSSTVTFPSSPSFSLTKHAVLHALQHPPSFAKMIRPFSVHHWMTLEWYNPNEMREQLRCPWSTWSGKSRVSMHSCQDHDVFLPHVQLVDRVLGSLHPLLQGFLSLYDSGLLSDQ